MSSAHSPRSQPPKQPLLNLSAHSPYATAPPKVAHFAATPHLVDDSRPPPPVLSPPEEEEEDEHPDSSHRHDRVTDAGHTPFPIMPRSHAADGDDTPEDVNHPSSDHNYYGDSLSSSSYYGGGGGSGGGEEEETPEEVKAYANIYQASKAGHTPFPVMGGIDEGGAGGDDDDYYGVETTPESAGFGAMNGSANPETPGGGGGGMSHYYPDASHLTPYAATSHGTDDNDASTKTPAARRTGAGHTPFPTVGDRLEAFRDIVANAPTPESFKNERESVELRMERRLAQLEQEKAHALRMVAELQNQLADLTQAQELNATPPADLYAFVQLMDAEGVTAAVEWAREQVNVDGGRKGLSLSPLARASPPVVPPRRQRATLALPMREQEVMDPFFLSQAVENLDFEYKTDLAMFTVRRPYGLADESDLWFAAGQLTAKQYAESSTVDDFSSIEVAAYMHMDSSYFVIYGDAFARHQDSSGNWTELGNVYEIDSGLGEIAYLDGDGNEQTYSLDLIFEAAASIRVTYCSNVRSLALGLRELENVQQSLPPSAENEGQALISKETAEANVGTEDLPFSPPSHSAAPEKAKGAAASPAAAADEPSPVVSLLKFIFSGLFTIVWAIVVQFPLAVLWRVSAHACALLLLATLHMYWKENYYSEMGNYPDFTWNQPGIS